MKKVLGIGIVSLFLGILLMSCFKGESKKQTEKHRKKYLNNTSNYLIKQRIVDKVRQKQWVDSIMRTMTPDEKLGQLFALKTFSNKAEYHYQGIEALIRKYHIGGLCFFQGNAETQTRLTNRYQKLSKIPLMISIDAEWGLDMRLDNTMNFPYQMTLGAIQHNQLIYEMGIEVAKQCKRIGVHVNFAPAIDINNNPKNPVIHYRSFGEDKVKVTQKSIAYMRGMQDYGVMACAKHFPGHGDTDQDSHLTLPRISHKRERLDTLELYPFRELIKNDVASIMVAHLEIPSLEPTPKLPTTLSKKVVTDLLQKELGFKGLIFTDALSMGGVTNHYPPGDVDVRALQAGNDVLLIPSNVPLALKKIKQALKKGTLTWQSIDNKVRKILEAKFFVGLDKYQPSSLKNLKEDLYSAKARILQEKLYASAITLVHNKDNLLPILEPQKYSFASVALGVGKPNKFQKMLDNYAKVKHFQIPKKAQKVIFDKVLNEASKHKVVFVSLNEMNKRRKENYSISQNQMNFIKALQQRTKVVLTVFGTAYSLSFFENSKNLICAYEDDEVAHHLVPQMLFGARRFIGKLPVSPTKNLKIGTGVFTQAYPKLKYSLVPESMGMSTTVMKDIDKMVENSIKQAMSPGCQFLIAKKGTVIWNKSYGYQTYNRRIPINNNTLYDVASITKVLGTLQAIQYLYQEGKLNLDAKVSSYLPEVALTNKKDIIVRDVLLHQAGLIPFIPFWTKTMNGKQRNPQYYATTKSDKYPHQVAKNMFIIKNIENILWGWSMESKRINKTTKGKHYQYKYSDMSFYVLKRIAEKLLNEPIEDFLYRQLYEPLGVETCYNPLEKYDISRIPPTENDVEFRQQLVHGFVHDQGAAMLGGVGGHAGLFASANDLAVLMQLQLQKGLYGNKRFFDSDVIETFTKQQFKENRRGLGWDKKDEESSSYMPDKHSEKAFGHSGFTGCVVWADPENELLIVFLSNRINPSVKNLKAIKTKLRNKVMNKVYEGFE